MLTSMVMVIALVLSEVERCAVFTDEAKVVEPSAAGKRYSSTIRVTYVDANCDGRATAIDIRNANLRDLVSFLAAEFPEDYEAIEPRCRALGLGVSFSPSGRLSTGVDSVGGGMKRVVAVREFDNRETYLRVQKQFGHPVAKRAEAALRVAERDAERARREQGRGR